MIVKTNNLRISDFMTGLLAALAMKEVRLLSLRHNRLDKAMEKLFEDLRQRASEENIRLLFRIRLHPIHQDSRVLKDALYEAAQRDLVSLDNPAFQDVRLKISADEAPDYFERTPGKREFYEWLADRLMNHYQEAA